MSIGARYDAAMLRLTSRVVVVPVCVFVSLLAPGRAAGQGPTQAELNAAGSNTADWLLTGHDYGGQRFVDLDQITRDNVGSLRTVCTFEPGYRSQWHPNPIVYQGVMYLTVGNATVAIDATTCDVRWRHDWEMKERPGFPQNRGVALKDGLAIRGTSDGFLIALDMADGTLRWERQAADSSIGESFTMPPLVYDDLVIIGPAGSENGVRGWVGAFRLVDGSPVWRFNTVPEPGEPGSETWSAPGDTRVGGGAVWTPFGFDPESGLVFVPVSNPAPDFFSEVRQGDNLYTGSIVVLDARSGELDWYFQAVPHDVHDYDQTQATPLFATTIDGERRNAVVTVGKNGILHTLDRTTHEHLYEVPVTRRENVSAPITVEGTRACPGVFGGVEWNGPAYNPRLDVLYVPAVDWCATFKRTEEVRFIPGRLYMGGSWIMDDFDDARGQLTAIDAGTGAVRWRYQSAMPMLASITTTSSGLVLTGELTGDFLVLDGDDGSVLRRIETGRSMQAGIVSYGIAGRQYIAVMAGNTSALWPTDPVDAQVIVLALE